MYQVIYDIECNRCKAVYKSSERTMSITVQHCIMSICPKCTQEVADLMGFTKENISKELCLIREAETEHNRKRRIDNGDVCKKCEKKFKEGVPRIRSSVASNTEAWHLECYG